MVWSPRSSVSIAAPPLDSDCLPAVPGLPLVLLDIRYRPIGVRDPRPIGGQAPTADTSRERTKEVIGCEPSSQGGSTCCTPQRRWPRWCSRPVPGTSRTKFGRSDISRKGRERHAQEDRVLPRSAGDAGDGRGRWLQARVTNQELHVEALGSACFGRRSRGPRRICGPPVASGRRGKERNAEGPQGLPQHRETHRVCVRSPFDPRRKVDRQGSRRQVVVDPVHQRVPLFDHGRGDMDVDGGSIAFDRPGHRRRSYPVSCSGAIVLALGNT